MLVDFTASKKPIPDDEDWVLLSPQQRQNIHPMFSSINDLPCEVYYNHRLKCFHALYDFDNYNNCYIMGSLSPSAPRIVEDITEYYNDVK